MCTPLAMAGVQVASTLAQGAAEARAQRQQARNVERQARADAADLAASAEFARDRAARDSATARARALVTAVDPASESLVASLADAHARRIDPALRDEAAARARLADGLEQARDIRRASRAAVYRSLLGSAGSLAGRGSGGGVITIPI